jgi:hypothetical protein
MRLFRLCALLGVMALWAGCGLPDSFYLVPPAVGIQASPTGSPFFTINGTDRGSDTGAIFEGYELYYKFYGSAGGPADPTFNSDLTTFTTGSTNIDLQQAGFHRMCLGPNSVSLAPDTSAGYASAPLINISHIDPTHINQSYTVTVKLNDQFPVPPAPAIIPAGSSPPLSYYLYTPPGSSAATAYAEVRRFVNAQTGSLCKSFAPNSTLPSPLVNWDPPAYQDVDLSGSTGPAIWNEVLSSSGYIYVMIYALSYGKSIVDFTPIYSSPVLLGYVNAVVEP